MKLANPAMFMIAIVCTLNLACSSNDSSSSHPTAIGDVDSLKKRPDGKYDVTCTDGLADVVTLNQLQNGDVCAPIAPRNGVTCERFGEATDTYPSRIADHQRIGNFPMTRSECRDSLNHIDGLTCGGFTSDGTSQGSATYFAVSVATNSKIGEVGFSSLDNCVRNVLAAREGAVCAGVLPVPFDVVDSGESPYNFRTNLRLANFPMWDCNSQIMHASNGVVCARVDAATSYVFGVREFWGYAKVRVADGSQVSALGNADYCYFPTH